ncbi:MAG TPA: hypothetical protein VHU92_27190 [Streptosporangiaceae bacterium]|jgi:hypothetical protein|nr:hypothetical protein [Streptosporangiaceae bacterium]
MRYTRRGLLAPVAAGLVTAAMAMTTVAASGPAAGAAAARHAAAGPTIKLIKAESTLTVRRHGKGVVYLDPNIYVAALGAPFQVDPQRSSYTKPVQAYEILNGHRRLLPSWVMSGWNGLRDFIQLQVRNTRGKVVASRLLNYCPDTYDPARVDPAGATKSPYPQTCREQDPFPRSSVWGIARGWATDPTELSHTPNFKLSLGRYHVTETIPARYVSLLGIPAEDASATMTLNVVKGAARDVQPAASVSKPLPSLPRNVPLLSHVPANALPDLVPLPSWGITTSHVRKTNQDFLNFGATVWVGGHSPLDVEGFRQPGTSTMAAYQYYWRHGKVIGRTRAGTMFYDNEKGHHHWHFQQFAKYVLLKANKKVAVRSEKVGFCIAPSDPVDLALPGATWNVPFFGLTGQCGVPAAVWVEEYMPVGWGDTYDQFKAGQAFNITHLPDGTYYIEIIANPEHLLHEVTRSNDTSLRKVIITGPAGHRQVRVPAWHGIDPEK